MRDRVRTELRVAQLLCSRVCHDLAGPAGAVHNGLELLSEGGGPFDVETQRLIGTSARRITRRLAFMRAAFGFAGGTAPTRLTDARDVALAWTEGGPIEIDWPVPVSTGPAAKADGVEGPPADGVRLLLVLVCTAAGALARGGTVSVRHADLPEGLGVALTASGPGASLPPDVLSAMHADASVEALTARNVHTFIAARLAAVLGTVIEVETDVSDQVKIASLIPLQA